MKETGTLWNLNKLHRELSRKLFISWECSVTKGLSSTWAGLPRQGGQSQQGWKGKGMALPRRDRDRAAAPVLRPCPALTEPTDTEHRENPAGTLNAGYIQLSLWPRSTKTSWAKALHKWRHDVVGIRLKERKKKKKLKNLTWNKNGKKPQGLPVY